MGYDAKRGEPIDKNPHVVTGKKKKVNLGVSNANAQTQTI